MVDQSVEDPQLYVDLLSALALTDAIAEYREHLRPGMWLLDDHRVVASVMLELYDSSHVTPLKRMVLRSLQTKISDKKYETVSKLVELIYSSDRRHAQSFKEELHTKLRQAMHTTTCVEYARLVREGELDRAEALITRAAGFGSGTPGIDYLAADAVQSRSAEGAEVYGRTRHVRTGYDEIDDRLYGGPAAGELYYVVADTGVGKSRALINLSKNALLQGKVVYFFTLQLSAAVVAGRHDQCLVGVPADQLMLEEARDFLQTRTQAIREYGGRLFIKQYPEHTATIGDLAAYIYRMGVQPDLVVIDYMDQMAMPQSDGGYWASQGSFYDKLRGAIGKTFECPVWTASQTNKSGEYYGAQSKHGAVDGSWIIRESDTDRQLSRQIWHVDKVRLHSRQGSRYHKMIILKDGMNMKMVPEWPDGYRVRKKESE